MQDKGWFPGALVCDPGGGRQRWAKAAEACWMEALLSLCGQSSPDPGRLPTMRVTFAAGAPSELSLQGYARKARESHFDCGSALRGGRWTE